ncbi:protein of unknown function [Micrococcales bacterium KH10]|nr:protein of unknown function [Micrococcales bacterium KH10]
MVVPATTPDGQPQVARIAQQPRTNICAILTLVFGLGGPPGVIFGHIALTQIKRTGETGPAWRSLASFSDTSAHV